MKRAIICQITWIAPSFWKSILLFRTSSNGHRPMAGEIWVVVVSTPAMEEKNSSTRLRIPRVALPSKQFRTFFYLGGVLLRIGVC